MTKSRYSSEQVASGLHQAAEVTLVSEVCRKMGISEQTFYRWKKKFQGMGVGAVRRLRVLEKENCKISHLLADLSLDKQMLQDVLRPPKPTQLPSRAEYLQVAHRVSERRACEVLTLARA